MVRPGPIQKGDDPPFELRRAGHRHPRGQPKCSTRSRDFDKLLRVVAGSFPCRHDAVVAGQFALNSRPAQAQYQISGLNQ